jgi:hypothetical protein
MWMAKRKMFCRLLEEKCKQGKSLLAIAPTSSSSGIRPVRSSTDLSRRAAGAELPVFAVFDLEGSHQLAFEITTGSLPTNKEPKSLPAYIPFQVAQAFVRKINERRMKAEWAVTRLSVILGILPALVFLLSHIGAMAGPAVSDREIFAARRQNAGVS